MIGIILDFFVLWITLYFVDRDEASEPAKLFLVCLGLSAFNVAIALALSGSPWLRLGAIFFVDVLLLSWWCRLTVGGSLLATGILLASKIALLFALGALMS